MKERITWIKLLWLRIGILFQVNGVLVLLKNFEAKFKFSKKNKQTNTPNNNNKSQRLQNVSIIFRDKYNAM